MRGYDLGAAAVMAIVATVGCGSSSDASSDTGAGGSGAAAGAGGSAAEAGTDGGAGGDAGSAGSDGGPGPQGCIDDTSAGQHQYTCDGFVYDVMVPDACVAGGCGLVFDVHGFSMSGDMEDANTAMRALGQQYGYVVVQPNANPAPPLASWKPPGDDDHVYAFFQLAVAAWQLDPKRLHFTGFSQGGAMTWRFICAHSDVLASAAPAAEEACFDGASAPAHEIPILFMHGTKDALVPFANATKQRDAVVAAWQMDAGQQIAGDGTFTRTRYTSPKGTVFEFIQHDYEAGSCLLKLGGHCFPGSDDHAGGLPGQACAFACIAPNAFTWGEEVMQFFIAHPKP